MSGFVNCDYRTTGDHALLSAVRLLAEFTGDHCQVDRLMGPHMARTRQIVMAELVGDKLPIAKCGIGAIQAEFYSRAGVTGDCGAARERAFARWCREAIGRPSKYDRADDLEAAGDSAGADEMRYGDLRRLCGR